MRRFLPTLAICAIGSLTGHAQLVSLGPWAGAVTDSSAVVVVRMHQDRLSTLEIADDRSFSHPISVPEMLPLEGQPPDVARFAPQNLQPDTTYYYRVRAGNLRDQQMTGQLRTLPRAGQVASFRFAVAGGARTDSTSGAYSEIGYHDPRFLIQLGNLHSEAIAENDPVPHYVAYQRVLGSPNRAELLRKIPLIYTWGRIDYGLQADRESPSARAVHLAYRHYMPHFPLAADQAPDLAEVPAGQRPIAQSFDVGRVRFLLLDTRTARDPATDPNVRGKTLLGRWQLDWLRGEFERPLAGAPPAMFFILTASPWKPTPTPLIDDWDNYARERDDIVQWLAQRYLTNVCVISANGGVLAAQGGGGDSALPELQVGEINLTPAPTDDRWAIGPIMHETLEEFFGMVEVEDRQTSVHLNFIGYNQNGQERLRAALDIAVRDR